MDFNQIFEDLNNFEAFEIMKESYHPKESPRYWIKIWFMMDGANIPTGAIGNKADNLEDAYKNALLRIEEKKSCKLF